MKIIAHRGASGEFYENTLLAFEQAIIQQCDGIELDVQYHHSGEFILLHDFLLHKKTNGKGRINDYSLEQLKNLRLVKGGAIPTLTQALKTINGRCLVNIEVKIDKKIKACNAASFSEIIEALTCCIKQAIKQYNFTWSHFIISSFKLELLSEIKYQTTQMNTAALIDFYPNERCLFAEELGVMSVNPPIQMVDKAFVDDAHKRGFQVWVYTVDTKPKIKKCADMNIDAIFTNYPQQTIERLKSF